MRCISRDYACVKCGADWWVVCEYRDTGKTRYACHPCRVKYRSSDEYKAYVRVKHREDPRRTMLHSCKVRAKKRGLPVTLGLEDIRVGTKCPVLGIPLFVADGVHEDNSPSVDRKDSKKGYTPENIEVISYRANKIKSDATYLELERVTSYTAETEAKDWIWSRVKKQP